MERDHGVEVEEQLGNLDHYGAARAGDGAADDQEAIDLLVIVPYGGVRQRIQYGLASVIDIELAPVRREHIQADHHACGAEAGVIDDGGEADGMVAVEPADQAE